MSTYNFFGIEDVIGPAGHGPVLATGTITLDTTLSTVQATYNDGAAYVNSYVDTAAGPSGNLYGSGPVTLPVFSLPMIIPACGDCGEIFTFDFTTDTVTMSGPYSELFGKVCISSHPLACTTNNNIVFGGVITPIPSTLPLFITAIALLGGVLKWKRKAQAVA
jgi:hypothetical protein